MRKKDFLPDILLGPANLPDLATLNCTIKLTT